MQLKIKQLTVLAIYLITTTPRKYPILTKERDVKIKKRPLSYFIENKKKVNFFLGHLKVKEMKCYNNSKKILQSQKVVKNTRFLSQQFISAIFS